MSDPIGAAQQQLGEMLISLHSCMQKMVMEYPEGEHPRAQSNVEDLWKETVLLEVDKFKTLVDGIEDALVHKGSLADVQQINAESSASLVSVYNESCQSKKQFTERLRELEEKMIPE